jgi:hypothetical protein
MFMISLVSIYICHSHYYNPHQPWHFHFTISIAPVFLTEAHVPAPPTSLRHADMVHHEKVDIQSICTSPQNLLQILNLRNIILFISNIMSATLTCSPLHKLNTAARTLNNLRQIRRMCGVEECVITPLVLPAITLIAVNLLTS